MTDVIKIANDRRARLIAELGKLDDFIRMAEALARAGQARYPAIGSERPALALGIGYDADLRRGDLKTRSGVAMVTASSPRDLSAETDDDTSISPNGAGLPSTQHPIEMSARVPAIRGDDTASSHRRFDGIASIQTWIRRVVDTASFKFAPRGRIKQRLTNVDRASALTIRDDNNASSNLDVRGIASIRLWMRGFVDAANSNLFTVEQLRDQWESKIGTPAAVEATVAFAGGVYENSSRSGSPYSSAHAPSSRAFRAGGDRFARYGKASLDEDELVLTNPVPNSATPVDAHVGQRLRQRRWMMGMTQKQLGNLVGVNLQQIQEYENGASRISAGRMWDIALAMGVPVLFFFEGLDGQMPDTGDARVEVLTDNEADELVRAYCAVPEDQRQRLLDLARVLSEAA